MSDVPKRTMYWWTQEQLESAGWRRANASLDDYPSLTFDRTLWHRSGSVVVYEGGGAWLPEPPPPDELSDEEVRAWIDRLRTRNHVNTRDIDRAADVIEAVLEYVKERERLYQMAPPSLKADMGKMGNSVMSALRRRPR